MMDSKRASVLLSGIAFCMDEWELELNWLRTEDGEGTQGVGPFKALSWWDVEDGLGSGRWKKWHFAVVDVGGWWIGG